MDMDCECKQWCRDGRPPLTEHHRDCPNRNLEAESVALASALIKGIESWAVDDGGVHPDVFDAYCKALVFVGDLAKLKMVLDRSNLTFRVAFEDGVAAEWPVDSN